ncbi:TPA: hypothetical protein HMV82_19605 [Escherichia coli]|jgi:hypothetical protein|uniref:Uncharacterized protein n=14 Tax=Enterobacteriaceae TaxID=543 RepID=J7FRM2_CITFR|nr:MULTISPECIES: hypothetical protein [Enterobacteriaceae]AIX52508.1 membrane protein [Pantoea sp. PSNIH1]AIX76451.1 membrane protein [Pantoea sp. PSNIH2]AKL33294.1 membrane protein [Klebsiella oxytoca]AUV04702.1 hypothetical protein C2U51_27945 [Enterobacteriaceae bacterium ENNIH1]EAB6151841.1 hypothetical protein [Salmonella enterica]EBC9802059.1 hypothetical protein [Salmonella enterica subsp. enterica serovar Senftenberg]EBI0099390.1 hypothetical protein [Salmonella enterica subsp. enter
MKFILLFFILVILIWGFTGLAFKEAIIFTSVGLSISVVALSALLVVVLTFVMAAMYATQELGALGKMIIAQVVLTGLWNLAFSIIPDGKLLSFFGVNIWQSGSYLVYFMAVLIAVFATFVAFQKQQ